MRGRRSLVPRLEICRFDVPHAASTSEWELNDGLTMRGFRAHGSGWLVIPSVAAFRFENEGAVLAVPDGEDTVAVEEAWLRSVLPLVIQARGTQVLHASAVAGPAGVLALCGVSGSGKSTLAAGLSQRGYDVVADDALPFAPGVGGVDVLPVPFRLRPRRGALNLVPVHVEPATREATLRDVIILRPGAAQPRSQRLPAAHAVGELMPHAYCFALEEGKQELVRAYAELAASTRVTALDYPREPTWLEPTVDVLEELLRA